MPQRIRNDSDIDELIRSLGPSGRIEDVAPALLANSEDACLIYIGRPESPQLVGTAVRDGNRRRLLPSNGAAPPDVKETMRTGIPRTLAWPVGAAAAHPSWASLQPLDPCHALIVPLDRGATIVGAIVLIRCQPDSPSYEEREVDVYRLVGLRIASELDFGRNESPIEAG